MSQMRVQNAAIDFIAALVFILVAVFMWAALAHFGYSQMLSAGAIRPALSPTKMATHSIRNT